MLRGYKEHLYKVNNCGGSHWEAQNLITTLVQISQPMVSSLDPCAKGSNTISFLLQEPPTHDTLAL